MKIAINATPIPAVECGAGVYIIELVQALAKVDSQNEYTIFAKAENKHHFDPLPPNFQVKYYRLKNRYERLLWEQLHLPRELEKYQPAVFHSPHYTLPFVTLKYRKVVTFHDMTFFIFPQYHEWLRQWIFRRIMRRSAQFADHIITVSENTKRDLIRLMNVPSNRVTAINSGVSAFFYPPASPPRNIATPYILFVGTLEPRKNLITLIQAFDLLCRECSIPHILKIVGHRGWKYQELFTEVHRRGLEARIEFTGYVSRPELRTLYQQADLFVYPSIYEGFGFPPLEAMACGTPAITTTAPAMSDLFVGGAQLVEPFDVKALKTAMQQVLTQPEWRKQLAQQGWQLAQTFDWQHTARKTIAVYQQFA
ncbi:MAG: glycosyltransferase family 1 protein [Gemmatimonadetes bacterium]|nr:MAG: glycosyltransferase family 1 protein [Gemmatimonadota bacterium]